ncbi:MAG: HlyD family efflux transporter periplasmic adaptor subunit [Gammaproteobacteria bacterium]|nr:HlyD family efflux transporter periplasmic adaptor subunit [Gammaproteobacteria bacterium]
MQPSLCRQPEILKIGPKRFVIVDKTSSQRFECSRGEIYLLKQMDGTRSLEEIRRDYSSRFGRELQKRQLREFLNHIIELGLVKPPDDSEYRISLAPTPGKSWHRANPVLNSRFDLLADLIGWVIHPIVVVPALALATIAITALINFSDYWINQLTLVSDDALQWILILVLGNTFLVTLPREILVGAASRNYGGNIGCFGVFFFRHIFPYFYCENQNVLSKMSRRGRWTMMSIRLWVNLVFASMATIAWMLAPEYSVLSMTYLLLILSSFFGFLVMANIFGKGDGYIILAYLFRTANLRDWAMAEARAFVTYKPGPRACSDHQRFWLRLYGLSIYVFQFLWFLIIIGLLSWLVISRLEGLGVLIAATLLVLWFRDSINDKLPNMKWHQFLVKTIGRQFTRWLLRLSFLGIVVAMGFIPYNYEIGGKARLIPAKQHGIRAQLNDEILEVHITEGDWVEEGGLIVTMAGRQEKVNVATTQAELERSRADLELLKSGVRREDLTIAREQVRTYGVQLEYYRSEVVRYNKLEKDNHTSAQALSLARRNRDEAASNLAASKANNLKLIKGARDPEIRALKANMERLEALLRHYNEMYSLREIRTTVAGQVVTSNVQERVGQTVEAGDLILIIHDTTSLQVEIAAEESAVGQIRPGMPIKVRLRGLDGRLLEGEVRYVSNTAIDAADFEIDLIRTDREAQLKQIQRHEEDRKIRIYANLYEYQENLVPGMSGSARIIVKNGILWKALARPVLRFFRVDVWSWLP